MLWTGGRATGARAFVPVALLCLGVAVDASAADVAGMSPIPDGTNLSRAHDAYARGAAAYREGDFARAARELAAADALVPDPVTLRAAVEAVTLADDPVLGAELVRRAERDPSDRALARAARIARQRFLHRTGSIVVRCDGCLAVVDGLPVPIGELLTVLPGTHTVSVQRRGSPETRLVPVAVDELREVRVKNLEASGDAAVSARTNLARESRGLSPVWFFTAFALTAGLGAVTVASFVSTANDHSEFEGARCGAIGGGSCASLASGGESAQTRTIWLGVATGVGAAGTAALGGLGVRWQVGSGEAAWLTTGRDTVFRVTF